MPRTFVSSGLSLPAELHNRVELARGDVARSLYLRKIIAQHLDRQKKEGGAGAR